MLLRQSSQCHSPARNRARCRQPRHIRSRQPVPVPVGVVYSRKARRIHPPKPPPARFPLFIQLPIEIRLKIWSFTLLPRVVQIIQCSNGHHNAAAGGSFTHRFKNITVPTALHVCGEARNEYLNHYDLVSLSNTRMLGNSSIKPDDRKCYINFENDTIFPHLYGDLVYVQLSGNGLFKALGNCWKKITQIAFSDGRPTEEGWILALMGLEKLRRIDIVCGTFTDVAHEKNAFFQRPIVEDQPPIIDWPSFGGSTIPFWKEICKTRYLSWEHLLQSKAKSLGLRLWPRPISLDFVVLRTPNIHGQKSVRKPEPHFQHPLPLQPTGRRTRWMEEDSLRPRWMEGTDDFWDRK